MLTIHIVTPLSRVENLKALETNISLYQRPDLYNIIWWVIVDHTKSDWLLNSDAAYEFDRPGFERRMLLNPNPNNIAGHSSRNLVLERLDGRIGHEMDIFYSLDDDNILHSDFFLHLGKWVNSFSGVIVSQKHKNGSLRLLANPDCVLPGHIDTAMYAFKMHIVQGLRFDETDYCADGTFIERLYNLNRDKFTVMPNDNCYYNYLR